MELDRDDVIRPLGPEALQERRRRLTELGGDHLQPSGAAASDAAELTQTDLNPKIEKHFKRVK